MDQTLSTLTIAVDFDGVLTHNDHWPELGPPRRLIIACIRFMQRCGHIVILNTCRDRKRLDCAVGLMEYHGLFFDYINENNPERVTRYGSESRKISADYYIEDRACFSVLAWTLYVTLRCWLRRKKIIIGGNV